MLHRASHRVSQRKRSKTLLAWQPKYNLQMLIEEMMASDVELFRKELNLRNAGYTVLNQEE